MDFSFFILLVVLSLGFSLFLGNLAARGQTTSFDYFLMRRELGLIPLTLTLLATQLGGVVLLGSAEEAMRYGWWVVSFPLGLCIGMIILGSGLGRKLRKLKLSTTAEIFEVVYQSTLLRKWAALLSLISLFILLTAQGVATKKFFAVLGIQEPYLFFIVWAVMVFYTTLGGLKSVVWTDVFQALFIVAVLGVSLFYHQEAVVQVSGENSELSALPWISWFILPMTFLLIGQDMGQRIFASHSSRILLPACLIAALLLFLSALVAIYYGIIAKSQGLTANSGESILILSVIQNTNPWMSAAFMCAILLAILSTADALLNSMSSNICYDFQLKKGMKWSSAFIGMSSFGVALFYEEILPLVLFSSELSVSMLFVPTCLGALIQKPPRFAGWLGVVGGVVGFFLSPWFPWPRIISSLFFSFLGFGLTLVLQQTGYQEDKIND